MAPVVFHSPVFPAYSQLPSDIISEPPYLFVSRMTTLMRRLGLDQRSTILLAFTGPRKTPHLNCLPSTVLAWFHRRVPHQLDVKVLKMAVSLSDPRHPKAPLQILTTTLRSKTLKSMPSCSKASGVFSSRCRYPASSRESHFHRAHR